MSRFCYTWNTANFKWNDNPYKWNEVCFALALVESSGGGIEDSAKWSNKKKREFIKLYCKVRAQNEPVLSYEWRPLELTQECDLSTVTITARDIRVVVEKVLNITVEM